MTGTTTAFLHGWGLHGGIWRDIADRFPDLDVRLPDLPGYGTSPASHPYNPAGLADTLAAAQAGPCVLVGWSMGGMTALAWAARHPEQVKALVLVGTSPVFVNRPDWQYGLAPELLAGFADALATDYRATLLRFLSLQARGGDAAREVIARLRGSVLEREEPRPDTLAAGLALLREVDLRQEAPRVSCPTLIVHGGYDNLCPVAAGEWLAQAIPGARLAVHPRAAHAPFLSHPDWFGENLRAFLDESGA